MRLLRPSPRHSGAIKILQRAERRRLRSSLYEARFDDGVEASVGQARSVSVPPRGNRHPRTDDFLALVVPDVELKLGVFGNHTAEEAFKNWVVVQKLGPDRPLPEAGRVWEVSGPLGWTSVDSRGPAGPVTFRWQHHAT